MPGVVTGKDVRIGASEGRTKAAGQGVAYCLEAWARERGLELRGARVVLQGFGSLRRTVAGFVGGTAIPRSDFWEPEADVSVPPALAAVIDATLAERVRVRVVAEGASNPTQPEGDRVLQERGIDLTPDLTCVGKPIGVRTAAKVVALKRIEGLYLVEGFSQEPRGAQP